MFFLNLNLDVLKYLTLIMRTVNGFSRDTPVGGSASRRRVVSGAQKSESFPIRFFSCHAGRGGEIRTHGRFNPTSVFKTGALNHSATPPCCVSCGGKKTYFFGFGK